MRRKEYAARFVKQQACRGRILPVYRCDAEQPCTSTNIDGRGLSLLFRQSKNVATISSSIVSVVQRIEHWFPKPVMWVRFPPGTLGSAPLPSSAEFSGEPFSEKQKRSGHMNVAGAFAKGLPHLCRHGGCSVPPMVTGEKPGAGLGLPMKA